MPFIINIMFDAYYKWYYPDRRPKCFKGSSCRKADCDYVHPQDCKRLFSVSNYTNQYAQQSNQSKEKKEKTQIYIQIFKKIEDLMRKIPNFYQKIKEKIQISPEEKQLQYLLHKRDKHTDWIEVRQEKCSIKCGDFYFYQCLSQKLDFGQKHPTRTWRQVEAIDPGFISFLCENLNNRHSGKYIAEYIRRERKAQKQDLLKNQQRNQRQRGQRGDGIEERRSRSRQRQ